MIRRAILILATLLLSLAGPARAQDAAGFPAFLKSVRQDALAQGISPRTLDQTLAKAQFIPHVIELDHQQPETTLTFQDYLARIVSPTRLDNGHAQLAQNRDILDQVGARYGVQPRFIVALWGIETNFGSNTGKYNVISALATLAYEGRRATFFRKELLNALAMVDRVHVPAAEMTGSWAGAMGQSQFMPSSFLNFAVSWHGDAAPDIWQKRDDVFASIANYLASNGWRGDEGWGVEVLPPPELDATQIGLASSKSIGDWELLGIVAANNATLPDQSLPASLIEPGGPDGPAYLVFGNYRTILKWNNSSYFATAVGNLADGIN
jgi:membrane-bound lytic murein transglycosylase B